MARHQGLVAASSDRSPASLPTVPEKDVDRVLSMLRPLVEAVGATVGAHCEVVLHDLRVPERSVVAIWNGQVTGRRIGGPVVGGPSKDVALKMLDSSVTESTLSVNYKTQARDGRELRSSSMVYRTPEGKPVIALCVNLDLSAMTMVRQLLDEITRPAPAESAAAEDDAGQIDVSEIVEKIIRESVTEVGKPPKFMDRDERLRAVRLMHERGLFLIRGGVERAAGALGIARFTMYSYLKDVRGA